MAERRRRAAARRHSRGRAGKRIAFVLARLALMAVVLGCSVFIVVKVVHPYKLYWQLRGENATDTARLRTLERDNERLQRRIRYLNTPEGETAQARGQGYHNPDEHPVRTQEPVAPTPPQ